MNEINYKEVLEDIAESQSLTVEKLVEVVSDKSNKLVIKKETASFPLIPMCSTDTNPAPNVLLRSALFGVVKRGARKTFKNHEISSVGDYSVLMTGEQLDQADFDVWNHLVGLFKGQSLNNEVKASKNSILKYLGKTGCKSNYIWLSSSLERLNHVSINLKAGRKGYMGHLIDDITYNDNSDILVIRFNPRLATLFSDREWTALDIKKRTELGSNQLAMWLYSFYASHKKPFNYKVETLHKLCGSATKELREFRRSLKDASLVLSHVTSWECFIDENDHFNVKRFKLIESSSESGS